MRTRFLIPAAMALIAAPVCTQADSVFWVPYGQQLFEQDSHNDELFNQPSYYRYQQVCDDSVIISHVVRWMRFRRDGHMVTPGAVGRTVDVRIRVGLQHFANPFGNDFALNYTPGTSQVLFQRKPVNLPDWSQVPANAPAPFDLTFLADDIWFYSGQLDMVWEMEVWSNGPGSYAVDATSGTGAFLSANSRLGLGCATATSGPAGFSHTASLDVTGWGGSSQLAFAATGAPAQQLVIAMVGDDDPILPLGLCAPLRTDMLGSFPIGVSDATGALSRMFSLGPYWSGAAFATFYSQAVAFDPSQPGSVALSNGVEMIFPALPTPPYVIQHIFSTEEGAITGQGPFAGGMILELQDV